MDLTDTEGAKMIRPHYNGEFTFSSNDLMDRTQQHELDIRRNENASAIWIVQPQ